GFSIGGTGYITRAGWSFTGDIFEVAVFNRALSDGEVLKVEAWLRAKYDVLNKPRLLWVMDSLGNLNVPNTTVPQTLTTALLGVGYNYDASCIVMGGQT